MKHTSLLLVFACISILGVKSQSFEEHSKVVDPNRYSNEYFGETTLIADSLAFVGIPRNRFDINNENLLSNAGAVEVFTLETDGSWKFSQKLCASDRSEEGGFGKSMALDGEYLAVGAYFESFDAEGLNEINGAGAIYLFKKDAMGLFQQVQKLVPDERGFEDEFGESIGFEEGILVTGASYDDEDVSGGNLAYEAGSAFVFKQNESGLLEQIQKLTSPFRYSGDYFGCDVALSLPWLVVGADYESDDENEENKVTFAGAAYTFKWNNQSGSFDYVQKLVAADRRALDYLGEEVAICDTNILLGVKNQDYNEFNLEWNSNTGAAYIFGYNETDGWVQRQKLVSPNRGQQYRFGSSVAIDSAYLLIGAPNEILADDPANPKVEAGMAYLYQRTAEGSWDLAQTLQVSDHKAQAGVGASVDLSGQKLLIGANLEKTDENDENPVSGAGAAYIFHQHICTPTFHTIDTTACDQYESPTGKTFTLPGTYYDTLVNAGGCDSIITIQLDFIEIDTSVVLNGTILSSNEQGAEAYQWIDCENDTPIDGANTSTYQASSNGSYAVILHLGGCIDTSACHTITASDVPETAREEFLVPYPNPCTESFRMNVNSPTRIAIYSVSGQKMLQQEAYQGQRIMIEELSAGLYFVKVRLEDETITKKLIIR